MSSLKKSSMIWNYFEIKNEVQAQCKFCNNILSYKTSITNLRQHILRKHPSIKLYKNEKIKIENENTSNASEKQLSSSSPKIFNENISDPSTSKACDTENNVSDLSAFTMTTSSISSTEEKDLYNRPSTNPACKKNISNKIVHSKKNGSATK